MVNIRLVAVGLMGKSWGLDKVEQWDSALFKVISKTVSIPLDFDSDLYWAYPDSQLQQKLPSSKSIAGLCNNPQDKADLTFYIMDAPIEKNWFSRIFDGDRIVITFYQAKEMLTEAHIPFENYLFKNIYYYSLLYLKKGRSTLSIQDEFLLTHAARRGCIFDMCGIKSDLIDSCLQPKICLYCKQKLSTGPNIIDNGTLDSIDKELKKLNRGWYLGLVHRIGVRPLFGILVSAIVSAIVSYMVLKLITL